jgi:hypothetical protein
VSSDYEGIRRQLLSCSLCGTYQGDADLVVACEQADAAALAAAWAALCAEQPALWAERCDCCDRPLTAEQIAEHRRSCLLQRTDEVPAPLCDQCVQLTSDLDAGDGQRLTGESSAEVVPDEVLEAAFVFSDMETDLHVLLSDVEQAGRTAGEMYAALAALIAEVEGGRSGGGRS